MNIIGLIGAAGAGKDTVAGFLATHGYIQVSFADTLKRYIGMEIFGLTKEQVFGSKESKETIDKKYGRTPREILQLAGVSMRDIYPDVWVDLALRQMRSYGSYSDDMYFVVSDVRFLNEVEALRRHGAEIWRINKEGSGATGEMGNHRSETELAGYDSADEVINNCGSLEMLGKKVEGLVEDGW